MLPSKLTIAIIAYHGDLLLLHRLLTSIEKHCNLDQIDSIKIVMNDRPVHYPAIKRVTDNFLNLKIQLVTPFELEPRVNFFHWNSQQLYKCVIADIIDTEWYLIHDCKDFYTSNVDFFKECFNPEGKAITQLDHSTLNTQMTGPLPFSMSLEVSSTVWGVDFLEHKKWHLPTITPFFVKTEVMRSMTKELKSMMKGLFPFLFDIKIDHDRFTTEFFLFSAYCTARNNLTDYVDWSYNKSYYDKVSQSKDLRISFPNYPVKGQKFYSNGTMWIRDEMDWVELVGNKN